MEQAVYLIQQELTTIRVASRVHMSEAVHADDNLTTAQAHEDAPSTIDVNIRGRLKESSGKESGFQQWAKKTDAFQESEMVLEWALDQTMEITTTAIDLEFLLTDSNDQRILKTTSVEIVRNRHVFF